MAIGNNWFEKQIIDAAQSLHHAHQSSISFVDKIKTHLKKEPLQSWEIDQWLRGLKHRLLKMEGYFLRIGSGKRSALSLFVRNDQGLNVGLKREAITQMATFISLITDYGYSRRQTRFETRWMDVAVFDDNGDAMIYAENKASEKTLKQLCAELETNYENQIPNIDVDPNSNVKIKDSDMKANHIWRNKPSYFWGLCPTYRSAYTIDYNQFGFKLNHIENIPASFELEQKQTVNF